MMRTTLQRGAAAAVFAATAITFPHAWAQTPPADTAPGGVEPLSPSPAADASGWSDIGGWGIFGLIVVLVLIVMLIWILRRPRRTQPHQQPQPDADVKDRRPPP